VLFAQFLLQVLILLANLLKASCTADGQCGKAGKFFKDSHVPMGKLSVVPFVDDLDDADGAVFYF